MTQQLVAAAAAACKECSDYYDPQGGEDEDFLDAWRSLYAGYEALAAGCPRCDTEDPGNPPPP